MYSLIKRFSDVSIAAIALLLFLPLFIVVSFIIKVESRGPIFFRQKRIGKDKREFYIYKFRTMRTDAPKDTPTHLLESPDAYITKIGKFLRKSSLDELPQLINILKGEMSIVGPRPALWNQYDLIAERDKYQANDIYPGLTGWAQINGRDELPIDVKARFDGEYVEKMSLLLDIKIFFTTFFKLFLASGVVEGGTGSIVKADKEDKGQVLN